MKKNSQNPSLRIYKPSQPAYPNAADNNYFARKAVDLITAIVSGMGFVSAMLFLLTM